MVIYAENRSFDNLYGHFPGANGLQNVTPDMVRQLDRDGTPLKELPPVWGGLTAPGVVPPVTQAQTEHLPNALFAIDDPKGFNQSLAVTTRDLWHRFYQNQMQINGGKNNVRRLCGRGWSGHGLLRWPKLPLWNIAQHYVLADNFFTGAFGGSFLNHFVMICGCAPHYPNGNETPAKAQISCRRTGRRDVEDRRQLAQIGHGWHAESSSTTAG